MYRHGWNLLKGFSHAWTNRWNKGLISVDRRAKPTLVLTIPRSLFKSSTKDLSFPMFEIVMTYDAAFRYRYSRSIGKGEYRRFPAWILT